MFEKEAEEYADKDFGMYEPTGHERYAKETDWRNGAEFGYNKKCEETFEMALSQIKHDRAVVIEENERLHAKNADLEAQIEKMKCCGNCKYFRFVNGAEYYTCIKDGKRNGEDYRSCGFNLEKWELWV